MSGGYASRLSEYGNKGLCGLSESSDTKRLITSKTKQLAKLIQQAKNVVVITGAGISTQAGIPDFRGPEGVWTLEEKANKKRKRSKNNNNDSNDGNSDDSNDGNGQSSNDKTGNNDIGNDGNDQSSNGNGKVNTGETSNSQSRTGDKISTKKTLDDFTQAKPTICHRAITKLVSLRKINYCITQNVDGLHRRAGLSRDHHASVHGCVFTEKCDACGAEFFRDFDVGGMSFQPTGRNCSWRRCSGVLRDTLLDWEDGLPQDDFERAGEEVEKPGTFVLCLGTSLRIMPIGGMPERATNYAIVNLQITPMDERAELIIRAPVDDVMKELMEFLKFPDWQDEPNPPIEKVWKPKEFIPGSWPPPKKKDAEG